MDITRYLLELLNGRKPGSLPTLCFAEGFSEPIKNRGACMHLWQCSYTLKALANKVKYHTLAAAATSHKGLPDVPNGS